MQKKQTCVWCDAQVTRVNQVNSKRARELKRLCREKPIKGNRAREAPSRIFRAPSTPLYALLRGVYDTSRGRAGACSSSSAQRCSSAETHLRPRHTYTSA